MGPLIFDLSTTLQVVTGVLLFFAVKVLIEFVQALHYSMQRADESVSFDFVLEKFRVLEDRLDTLEASEKGTNNEERNN